MSDGEITRLLAGAVGGDRVALNRLYGAVYSEMWVLARAQLRRESHARTLQPTVLVHEAFLRLGAPVGGWDNRRHFFGAAAEAMRRILVEHARQRLAQKRGAGAERVTLSGVDLPVESDDTDILDLDAALTRLSVERPRIAELVKLRYFAGLGIEDAARALDVSPATVKRDWLFARAWLQSDIEAHREPP